MMDMFKKSQNSSALSVREKKVIIAVLAAALIARFALFFAVAVRNPEGFLDTDSPSYIAVADDLARFGTYTSGGFPEHSRTPGLPFYLILFSPFRDKILAAVAVQIIFSAASCLLAMLFVKRLSGGLPAMAAAGLILALDVPSVVMANLVMTETLFTFLLVLSVYLATGKNTAAIFCSGLAVGAVILFRPAGAYLPLLMVIYLLIRKKKIAAAAYITGCILLVSPWLIRNTVAFGSPFLSTISSINMLYYRAAGVHSVKNEIPFKKSQAVLREKVESEFSGIEGTPVSRAAYERKLGKSIIRSDPGIYVRNHIMSVAAMMLSPMRSSLDIQLGLSPEGSTLEIWREGGRSGLISDMRKITSGFTIYAVVLQLIMLLAVYALAAVAFFSRKRRKLFLPAAVILYFILISGGPEAYARFRTPVVPFIAVLSGIGADCFKENKGKNKKLFS